MNFDVIVIGGGPGGYVAAIRSAQLNYKVACIDNYKRDNKYSLGGTCLNVGCIPSKALLQSSENYSQLLHSFSAHGISCDNPSIDIKKMLSRKNEIVEKNANGISFLFKKNKITELHGLASIIAKTEDGKWIVGIEGSDSQYIANHVIIATGSLPRELSQIKIDNKNILDNQGALELTQTPKTLCIIGGGVIGIEMGSVWNRLGSKVVILEASSQFLAAADEAIAKELLKNLHKQGITINAGIKLDTVVDGKNGVTINYANADGSKQTINCDKLIIAVGRVPNTAKLNATKIGLKLDNKGFIEVDSECKTNLPNVWAIGDCVRGPMLAHKASDEGVMVAERISGQQPHLDFNFIPWVIYTDPEVAWVGKTETQLKQDKIEYKKGQASFMANGRALGLGNNTGFVKILACAKTDRILGIHICGPFASELISEAVVAMEFYASSEDLARIIHAHPSLTEVIHEAALACDNRPLHG
jgi:dihydrolipoamide dehydrogenase